MFTGGGSNMDRRLFWQYHIMAEIEQPNLELQKKLDEILSAQPEEILLSGKTVKIGWLRNGTVRKFTNVMMNEEDPIKRNIKLYTLVLLNNKWSIMFLYWFLWRWNYYIKDIDSVDVLKVLDASKKKVPHEPYLMATILATGMQDLMMTMTKKEVKLFRAEQHSEQPTV